MPSAHTRGRGVRPTRPCWTSYSPLCQKFLAKTLTTYSLLLLTPTKTQFARKPLPVLYLSSTPMEPVSNLNLNVNVFTTAVQEINRYVYSHLLFSFSFSSLHLVEDLVFKKCPDISYQDTLVRLSGLFFHKTVLISILISTVLWMVALGNEEQVGCNCWLIRVSNTELNTGIETKRRLSRRKTPDLPCTWSSISFSVGKILCSERS